MKKIVLLLKIVIGLYLLLLIPLPQNKLELHQPSETPFIWNQDKLWETLENTFKEAKEMPPEKLDSLVYKLTFETDSQLMGYEEAIHNPEDTIFDFIENRFYRIAPLIAAQENKTD